jgi:hypothetical protein
MTYLMLKIKSNTGKVLLFITLLTSVTVLADDAFKKLKWDVGFNQQNSSNPFDPIDPDSILVTDPAYSAQDPISVLLTDTAYSAQDPESVEIVTKIVSQTYETSSKKEVVTGARPNDEIKTNKEKIVSLDSAGNTVTKIFNLSSKVTTIPITTTSTKTTTRTTLYEDNSTSTKVTNIDITENTIDKEIGRLEVKRELVSTEVEANPKKTWFTSVSDKKTVTHDPVVSSSTPVEKKVESTDKNGSTVIDTYHTYIDTITTPTVTTTTTTTTEHTLWTDGKTTTSDMTTSKDTPLTNVITIKTREEHVDKKIIPKFVSEYDTQEITTKSFKGKPTVDSDCTVKEKRHRDGSKNIIIRMSEICMYTITTPITTVKTIITKRNTLWTDGNTTSKEIDVHTEESTISTTTTSTIERKLGSEIIEYQKLDEKYSQDKLEDYLNNIGVDPDKLTQSERKKFADLICQKFEAQGIEFTLSARLYGSEHNWNEPSGFEKLYDLIEKCLRD